MKDLESILQKIRDTNDKYRTLKLGDTHTQSELLRDITCCYVDLTDHKREARESWMNAYNLHKGSHAAKERFADTEAPEYDLIKDVLTACKLLKESIVSTLSANKNG
jgi:hypothetical protein